MTWSARSLSCAPSEDAGISPEIRGAQEMRFSKELESTAVCAVHRSPTRLGAERGGSEALDQCPFGLTSATARSKWRQGFHDSDALRV